MPMYLERYLYSASTAASPGLRADLMKLLEANVSTQVESQTGHFWIEKGIE